MDVHGGATAVPLGQRYGRPRRQVRTVQGDLGRVRARAGDPEFVGGGHGDLVVEAHREKDVGQVMETVGAGCPHRELDVDLRGDADGDTHLPGSLCWGLALVKTGAGTVTCRVLVVDGDLGEDLDGGGHSPGPSC